MGYPQGAGPQARLGLRLTTKAVGLGDPALTLRCSKMRRGRRKRFFLFSCQVDPGWIAAALLLSASAVYKIRGYYERGGFVLVRSVGSAWFRSSVRSSVSRSVGSSVSRSVHYPHD